MAEASTIHLTMDIPGSKNKKLQGYIQKQNEQGVWFGDRDDGRGKNSFVPMHLILSVEYETGWKY